MDKILKNEASDIQVTLNGKLSSDGKDGKALKGYAECYNDKSLAFAGNDNFTVEAWVKPESTETTTPIITKGNDEWMCTESYGLKRNVTHDSETGKKTKDVLEFYIYNTIWDADNGVYTKVSASIPTPADWSAKWHHVAGSYDGKTLNLFYDGKVVATAEDETGVIRGGNPVGIGADITYDAQNPNVPDTFKGKIDGVRIYKKALSVDELNKEDRKPEDATVLWLDFEGTTDKKYSQKTFYSFGGDWADIPTGNPNNKNFCANGLVSADRTVQPEVAEVKKIYQDITITDKDVLNGTVTIQNKNLFTNVKEYDAVWELMENGKAIQKGKINSKSLDIKPLSKKTVKIAYKKPTIKAGSEYFLNVHIRLKNDTVWAKKGHEVAMGQMKLAYQVPKAKEVMLKNMKAVTVKEAADKTTVSGKEFKVIFNKATGTLDSYQYKGKELLEEGPKPNFWRAPTDSDLGYFSPLTLGTWRYAGEERKIVNVEVVNIGDKAVRFTVTSTLPTLIESDYKQVYTVYGSGDVKVESTLKPGSDTLSMIPEIGNMLTLPKEFDNITWYGKGPEENYVDRQTGYNVGLYKSTVKDFFVDYIKPQETGNRTDTRWVSLTNDAGIGFMVKAESVIEFNALFYTPEQLSNALHSYMLPKAKNITLRINQRQMGLGGDNSWGAKPLTPYQNPANQTYEYTYVLKPISNNTTSSMIAESKKMPQNTVN